MLYSICPSKTGYEILNWSENGPPAISWIDLVNPTPQEKEAVSAHFHIDIPTKAHVQEIEQSSRLYQKNYSMYLTASIPVEKEGSRLEIALVTFILSQKGIVTVRYGDIPVFDAILSNPNRLKLQYDEHSSNLSLINALLALLIDYLADLLEKSMSEVDLLSRELFSHSHTRHPNMTSPSHTNFGKILFKIGVQGDSLSSLRDSLLSLNRLICFLTKRGDAIYFGLDMPLLSTVEKDLTSISDHGLFISNKISFLLDAVLGMINIEQNRTIKTFSVASVIFLPPTLLSSIWGMNYKDMPELSFHFGYPLALFCIVLSSIAPYWYFKKKRWL